MLIFLYIVLIILVISLLFALSLIVFLYITRVPFVRTPKEALSEIIKQIPNGNDITIVDIGSGDGSVLMEIEKMRPNATLIGYEMTPTAYAQAKIKKWLNKSNYQLHYKDFHHADLSKADIIFCFLIESVMSRVEKKLREEHKSGALVLSYGFRFPGWQSIRSIKNPHPRYKSKIHVYKQT